ncbi:MAG: dienelactone hydrolase family protein [Gemmataceae bacterium]|nr:dienelactone hydrolase family protein [Gemmataceae bacterium]
MRMTHSFLLLLCCTPVLPAQEAPFYPDKFDLLQLKSGDKDLPIRTPEEWRKRRAHILANMEKAMGPMPTEAKVPLAVDVTETVKTTTYIRKTLTYAAGKNNRVSAYLFIPARLNGKTPGILCLHPTSLALGKGIPAGLGDKKDRHYAIHLVERGYVALCPDYVKSGGYKFDPYENGFVSATMLGIWNHRVGLDLLQSLPEVDGDRLGVIGHSLGGHNSLFLAAFDERVKATVSNCGFCSFRSYMKGNLAGWSHAGYMPRIKSVYEAKPEKMPFDFTEVLAAIAPRAVLASAPVRDDNFDVDGVKECVKAAQPVFRLLGAEEKLSAVYPNAGHDFPDDARDASYKFFDRWLKR